MGVDVANLGKFKIATGSETHASREGLSACEIGVWARAQLHVDCVTMAELWLKEIIHRATEEP